MLLNLTLPQITLLYSGIMGLFYIVLTFNVIRLRRSKMVGLGHEMNPECPLFRAVRIHGNFSEYVPFILILMTLDEMTGRQAWVTHMFGLILFFGRIAYSLGITQTHLKSPGRFIGMISTLLCLLSLSLMLIYKGL
jgi:uncharacterized membrane protein YecN with MAPEG domain